MEEVVLSNKDQYPTDDIIFSHIGKKQSLWKSVFDYVHSKYPDISHEWRYYNDGKSWLLKAVRKSKTIFWLRVVPGTFRIAFYLNDKADELVSKSKISDKLKKEFLSTKGKSKFRAIVINFKNKKDLEYVKSLIEIKLSLK